MQTSLINFITNTVLFIMPLVALKLEYLHIDHIRLFQPLFFLYRLLPKAVLSLLH